MIRARKLVEAGENITIAFKDFKTAIFDYAGELFRARTG